MHFKRSPILQLDIGEERVPDYTRSQSWPRTDSLLPRRLISRQDRAPSQDHVSLGLQVQLFILRRTAELRTDQKAARNCRNRKGVRNRDTWNTPQNYIGMDRQGRGAEDLNGHIRWSRESVSIISNNMVLHPTNRLTEASKVEI